MIKYNPTRQQYEAWYINNLGESVMGAAIWDGAHSSTINKWKEEWGKKTQLLQDFYSVVKLYQDYNSIFYKEIIQAYELIK
jgi:hypothetical protein